MCDGADSEGEECMRTIVVDDERIMLRQFARLSRDIADLNLVGSFECASDAVRYAMGVSGGTGVH